MIAFAVIGSVMLTWLVVTIVSWTSKRECNLYVAEKAANGAEWSAGWLVRVAGFLRAGSDQYRVMRQAWYQERDQQ